MNVYRHGRPTPWEFAFAIRSSTTRTMEEVGSIPFPNPRKPLPKLIRSVWDRTCTRQAEGVPTECHPRPHRAQSVELTSGEMVEVRAAQRTFEGAYVRTALSQFSFSLVVLKVREVDDVDRFSQPAFKTYIIMMSYRVYLQRLRFGGMNGEEGGEAIRLDVGHGRLKSSSS